MPQSIQLIIDGTAATAATDELLALSDLSATRQADENHTTKGDPLTIAVAIVGIVFIFNSSSAPKPSTQSAT